MGSNFYNLPAPWNPGFAIPANVEAEGLRRATLVTGWMPRGTYFPSGPADNRYVIPGYIRNEPGHEAKVTQWPARGTYMGGRIAAGVPSSAAGSPIVKYGQKAAAHLVATVKQLPANQRGPALKVVLNKVDPTLWRRAGQHAATLRSRGATADAALQGGLAKAMSEGVLTELVQVGKTRRPPPKRSLLGLGCYGCGTVLGDVLEELGADHRGTTSNTTGVRNDDGSDPAATSHVLPTGDQISFGPFLFGAQGQRIRVHDVGALPPAWRTWFPAELKRLNDPSRQQTGPQSYGLDTFFPGQWPAGTLINTEFVNGRTPLFKGVNPVTGKPMGVFVNASPGVFEVWYRDVDLLREKSGWGKAWDKIKTVAAKVVHAVAKGGKAVADFAAKGLDKLKDLGCAMVNDPGTAGAAALASGPAGAVGVGLAQGICAPAETPEPVVGPMSSPPSNLTPLLIGGGILAALFLLK